MVGREPANIVAGALDLLDGVRPTREVLGEGSTSSLPRRPTPQQRKDRHGAPRRATRLLRATPTCEEVQAHADGDSSTHSAFSTSASPKASPKGSQGPKGERASKGSHSRAARRSKDRDLGGDELTAMFESGESFKRRATVWWAGSEEAEALAA